MQDLNQKIEAQNKQLTEVKLVTKVRSENYLVTGKLKNYEENESFELYLPISEEFMKKIVTAEETQNLPEASIWTRS